jgi:hypothetical protein
LLALLALLGKGVYRCGVPWYWAPEQASTQFTCFTGKKVPILAQKVRGGGALGA